MLKLRPATLRCSKPSTYHAASTNLIWNRHASLTGAISGGVRRAAAALKNAEKRRVREGQLGFWELKDAEKRAQAQANARRQREQQSERKRDLEWLSSDTTTPVKSDAELRNIGSSPKDRTPDQRRLSDKDRTSDGKGLRTRGRSMRKEMRSNRPEMRAGQAQKNPKVTALAKGMLVDAPQAMPYSEATSEFVYGTFAVLAALQAKKRKLHKLYIWCGEDGNLSDNDDTTIAIVREAKAAQVRIIRVAGNWDKLLDRMSDNRPHNGVVLEAAAIPRLSAKHLEKIDSPQSPLTVCLNHMSGPEKEDLGLAVNADTTDLLSAHRKGRYPFLLWLDRITDTGNMGAIIRSAYFLGVDAIILLRHGTAPLTAVTVKNSAGAAEHVPILTIENELDFMKQSQENGWLFIASGSASSKSTVAQSKKTAIMEQRPNQILKHRPIVLMMGNEGEGLRPFLQRQADHTVSIAGARADGPVDSLNVSVAAALLIQRFLAPYTTGPPSID